ncbi:MAG: tRNA (adenosine(37)-N6)-threonylcarbamoyltransferase complex dimerization subunit type 1 TsaB, partial [Pseudomonadota bacterium]
MSERVLALDTSGPFCAAALVSGAEVLARVEPMATGQAERLAPLVAGLLAEAGLSPRDLSLIAASTGPGSFTGVRIGVAFARGLALAARCPATGVTRLAALAEGARRPTLVCLGAGRGHIACQLFAGADHP